MVDIMVEDMGAWKNNHVDTEYVQVSVVEEDVQVEKCGPPASKSVLTYTLELIPQKYYLQNNHELQRCTSHMAR